MSEIMESTELYIYYVFAYTYIPMKKLKIRHSKNNNTNNKIKQLSEYTVINIMRL